MTGNPADADDAAARAAAIVRASGTSFYWGMRVLPRERRHAIYAVYAFCRSVDDIVDEPGDPATARTRLDGWRRDIERIFTGATPDDLVARALVPGVRRFGLPRCELEAVIDGMQSDLDGHNLAPSLDDFRIYCRRVAGAVGLLSIRCFGIDGPAAEPMALALGDALQITNILRDLGEDAAAGRLYLPSEILDRHGISERQPGAVLRHPALPAACAELAAIARRRYAEARGLMAQCDRRAVRPARLMMLRYEALLDRIVAGGWRDPYRRARLPRWRSLLLLRHLFL